jgi:fermentation-respiration switch protein FrsA (DUF1100 family)
MGRVMTATVVVLLACAAVVTLAWVFQRSLIYFPFGAVPTPSQAGLDDVELVTFDTVDGIRLHGWFVPRRPSPRFTLVVFNGNAGNRAYRSGLARAFREHGASVLLFDYRGYGGNDGHPTEAGLAADARAARAYLASRGASPWSTHRPRSYCARRSHRWPTSDACTTRGCPCDGCYAIDTRASSASHRSPARCW